MSPEQPPPGSLAEVRADFAEKATAFVLSLIEDACAAGMLFFFGVAAHAVVLGLFPVLRPLHVSLAALALAGLIRGIAELLARHVRRWRHRP